MQLSFDQERWMLFAGQTLLEGLSDPRERLMNPIVKQHFSSYAAIDREHDITYLTGYAESEPLEMASRRPY